MDQQYKNFQTKKTPLILEQNKINTRLLTKIKIKITKSWPYNRLKFNLLEIHTENKLQIKYKTFP